MEACQFAAACVCQRTQIITLRDRRKPWLFIGLKVWKGGKNTICSFEWFLVSNNTTILKKKNLHYSQFCCKNTKTKAVNPGVAVFIKLLTLLTKRNLNSVRWNFSRISEEQVIMKNSHTAVRYTLQTSLIPSRDPSSEWTWSDKWRVNVTAAQLRGVFVHLVAVTSPAVCV